MCLVDDDGETVVFVFLSDFRDNIRKLLHSSNDDAFAILYCLSQIPGMLRPYYSILDLHKLLDSISYLLVQNASVGDHKHGINHRVAIFFKSDQLMGEPRNGVGLTAACAVLNQITLSDAIL